MRPIASPNVIASTATARPTTSEMRAPNTVRAKTSRPRWSVPNQWSAEGPCRRSDGLRNCGSPAITPAARAISAMNASRPAPATMVGLRRANLRSCQRWSGAVRGNSVTTAISIPDARVEQSVGEVDGQGHQHVDAGEHHDDALDDRIVAPGDGVHHQPADAGNVE